MSILRAAQWGNIFMSYGSNTRQILLSQVFDPRESYSVAKRAVYINLFPEASKQKQHFTHLT